MKTRFIALSLAITAIFSLFGGCTAPNPANNLNADEKALYEVQTEISKNIASLHQELQNSDQNYTKIQELAGAADAFIKKNTSKVEQLSKSITENPVFEQTKDSMASAQRLVEKIDEVTAKIETLEAEIEGLTGAAGQETRNEIDQLEKSLYGYTTRLQKYIIEFENLTEMLLDPEKRVENEEKQAEDNGDNAPSEATI